MYAESRDNTSNCLDSASRELGRIRSRLRRLHGKVVRALEGLLATLPERIVVPDDVTVELKARTFAGEIRALGKKAEGFGPRLEETFTGDEANRILVLEVTTFAGEIEVTR